MNAAQPPGGTAPELLVVEHSLDRRSFDIGWFPDEIQHPSERRRCAGELRALELRWVPADASDDRWDAVQRRLEASAWATAQRLGWRLELVLLEASAAPPSRIRSYKGLLRSLGLVPGERALELEIPLPSGESLVAASAAIGEAEAPVALRQAWDGARAVVLALDPDQPAGREAWIRAFFATADLRGSVLISPTAAIARLAPGVRGVLRLVHPASDSHLAAVWFVRAGDLALLRGALESVLAPSLAPGIAEGR